MTPRWGRGPGPEGSGWNPRDPPPRRKSSWEASLFLLLPETLTGSCGPARPRGAPVAGGNSPSLVPQPQDIRNQRRCRQRRKAELVKLGATLRGLDSKATFFEEQGDHYSQYIRACLDQLAPRPKWVPPPAPRDLSPLPT